jgi:hypothetical protein
MPREQVMCAAVSCGAPEDWLPLRPDSQYAEAGIELRLESNVTAIDAKARHVGYAEQWDEISVDGDIAAKDCLLRYKSEGGVLAVASIYRDLASLQAELAMEQAVSSRGVTARAVFPKSQPIPARSPTNTVGWPDV